MAGEYDEGLVYVTIFKLEGDIYVCDDSLGVGWDGEVDFFGCIRDGSIYVHSSSL